MARLSSRAHPPARPGKLAGLSDPDEAIVVPNDTGSPLPEAHTPPRILCNEDRLSDSSESSLSPVVLDDDGNGEFPQDLDESETKSDESWEGEPEGDANRGQNLQFRLRAADLFPEDT